MIMKQKILKIVDVIKRESKEKVTHIIKPSFDDVPASALHLPSSS